MKIQRVLHDNMELSRHVTREDPPQHLSRRQLIRLTVAGDVVIQPGGGKLRAYRLQDEGFDTIDANRRLGLPDEARDFPVAARMLGLIGARQVRLMTNNPEKVALGRTRRPSLTLQSCPMT